MADLNTIQNALAAQITAKTGLRTLAQARDQISPPIAVILPGTPLIVYGETTDGTLIINLNVLLIVSDASPSEKSLRALDSYIGLGAGEVQSIPGAIMADNTLGGIVHWAMPINVSNVGRIEYAATPYWGCRLAVQVGTI